MTIHYSEPSKPYMKVNGAWTFDVYPNGVPTAFAEYPDHKSAEEDMDKTTTLYCGHSDSYEFLSGIKLPLIVKSCDIAKVLEAVRTTDANDISLREAKELQHLSSEQLQEALQILKARGDITSW